MRIRNLTLLATALFLSALTAWPQTPFQQIKSADPLSVRPVDKVPAGIDNQQRVTLHGMVHPLATPGNLVGGLPSDQPMEHMVMVLRPDPSQDAALDELIRAQQDPASPYYHQWLTPEAFGERFGISQSDMAQIANWIESQGLKVDTIPTSHRSIVFSGTAGQVETAFHTQMRRYLVGGESHFANATDPDIPQALLCVVKGLYSLHDFNSKPAHKTVPAFTLANGVNLLMPNDWDTIYDVAPLYSQGLNGSGQSIAVVGRTDLNLSDLQTFRTNAGLAANDPQKIFVNGVNPGMPDCNDEAESALDVEWAGATAKNATIDFVTAKTGATDGVVLAAQYAVTNNVAPIITMSYLHCENTLSDGGKSLWGNLWSQAAAQGQSVFVASGDSGAAGCDSATAQTATMGKAVNAICSTPNSTCVGGTEFSEGSNPGAYWSSTNGAGMSSALSYIPESTWNESSWAGAILASGGGTSTIYARPGWQAAPGVPPGTMRLVPDIAASSAVHDAYVIQIQGQTYYIAGTSAATPSLASVMAMVLQNAGSRQGNANPAFYTLASQQAAGGPAVFHDITSGNNSVPGVTGYSAATGYDMTTGLGSVDAFLLVNSWRNAMASNFSLNSLVSTLTVPPGSSTPATINMTVQGGFNSPVTLSAAGAPNGMTISFSSPTTTASGPVTMTVAATSGAAAGTFPVVVTGTGGGFSRTLEFTITVSAQTFTLTTNPTGASVNVGGSAPFNLAVAGVNGFNSAVTLSANGLPAGITASFSPAVIPAGGKQSTLTINVAASAVVGTSVIGVTGTSGNITQTQILTLSVANPNLTLNASATSGSMSPGGSLPVTLTTAAGTGFNSIVYLSVSGLPSGISATLSPSSIAAPGNGTSMLTITANSGAAAGVYNLTIGAVGGGATKTQSFALTVLGSASFTLSSSIASVSLLPGATSSVTLTTAKVNSFSAAVALSISGLPSGVTASFAPTSIAPPGAGTSTLTLTAASSAAGKTATLTVTAAGGGVTKTQAINLTVSGTFTLGLNASSASVAQGASLSITVNSTAGTGFSSAVAFSLTGLPSGATATFAPSSIAAPGSGHSTLTLAVGSSAAAGSYTLTVKATGGGLTATLPFSMTVPAPSFTLTESATSASVAPGGSASINLTTARVNGFSSAVAFSISGLPSGVTATFAPTSIASPGAGTSTLKLTAASTAAAQTSTLTITTTGGGITKTQAVYLTVTGTFALTASTTSATIVPGGSATVNLTTARGNGFSAAVALSISGLPSGVTATFTPTSIASPGAGTSTLKLTAASTAAAHTSTLTITATGGGVTRTQALTLAVAAVTSARVK